MVGRIEVRIDCGKIRAAAYAVGGAGEQNADCDDDPGGTVRDGNGTASDGRSAGGQRSVPGLLQGFGRFGGRTDGCFV